MSHMKRDVKHQNHTGINLEHNVVTSERVIMQAIYLSSKSVRTLTLDRSRCSGQNRKRQKGD